jgi:hypothetical protein
MVASKGFIVTTPIVALGQSLIVPHTTFSCLTKVLKGWHLRCQNPRNNPHLFPWFGQAFTYQPSPPQLMATWEVEPHRC